ncbi:MAG TPA: hypothetical protein VEK56_04185, partial [Vicinamibacterales bacterium]|nr:hypothetical protein [Vicinamibacterales bacterium]
MRALRQLATGMALCSLIVSHASAQTPAPPPTQKPTTQSAQPSPPAENATRPATTTVLGDTGLWYVPTAEVLPAKKWSFSFYRTNWDRTEAISDVSNFRLTFAGGLGDHVELFGSIDAQRRIDSDRRPFSLIRAGGAPMDDPFINDAWQTGFGDVRIGAKVNFTSQWQNDPVALGVRGVLKLPTSDTDKGLGTGKLDAYIDAIISGEAAQRVELSGYGGYIHRGDPDEFELSDGFRWGLGAGFPSRAKFRVTTELVGERYFDQDVTANGTLTLGSPRTWRVQHPADFVIGFTYQARNGFFAGWGASYGFGTHNREKIAGAQFTNTEWYDKWGNQVRIGWHPGVR